MESEEIIINGTKQIFVVNIPDELYEDYLDAGLDDTIELDDVVKKVEQSE